MALTKNSFTNTMIGSSGTVNTGSGTGGQILTTNTTGVIWSSPVLTITTNQSGILQLEGTNADIQINGESLMETLHGIQDRLNMLQPNPELEAEWDELRELGEQYRKLEAEFKSKSKMWNTLKKK